MGKTWRRDFPSRSLTRIGLLVGVPISLFASVRAAVWAATQLKTWTDGETLTAADLNANFAGLQADITTVQQTSVSVHGGTLDGLLNADAGIKIGAVSTPCNAAAAGTLRYEATTAQLQLCNGVNWLGVMTTADSLVTCTSIRNANAAAANGMYPLSAAGVTFQAYCDMDAGGFTLIQSHIAAQASTEAAFVSPRSGKYLPGFIVSSLASRSIRIRIQTPGTNNYVENLDLFPLSQLRQLKMLSDDPNRDTSGTLHWIGNGNVGPDNLNYLCEATDYGGAYPALYWACGNAAGLHLMPSPNDAALHGFRDNSEDIDVLVR